MSKSNGKKYDGGKLRVDLVQPEFIEEVAEILTFGAEKYGPNNWQKVEGPVDRYYAALVRHLLAYRKGEVIDPESSKSHLAHAACNLMFLMYFQKEATRPVSYAFVYDGEAK